MMAETLAAVRLGSRLSPAGGADVRGTAPY